MKQKTAKRAAHGPGRPPLDGGKAMMAPITIRFPGPMMARIDAIIARRIDGPDKGQVVRELVALGLSAMDASAGGGKGRK